MRPITAADLMNPEVLTIGADATVQELAAFLLDNEITGAPVEDDEGDVIGVVSLVDVAEVASGGTGIGFDRSNPNYYVRGWEDSLDFDEMKRMHIENEGLLVRDVMTPEVYSVEEDATVSEVARMMLEGHVHRLLVMRDGKVVGIVSTSDLLGLLVEESD
jgi:CBS domain-containing protein